MGVTLNSKRANQGTVPFSSCEKGTVPLSCLSSCEKGTVPLRLPQRQAFTLVELLTVVTIIGILVGLITAAAIAARTAAKRAAIRMEINQLDAAVERYKSERGEYPPDFAGISSTNTDVRAAGIRAVVRHLRKAFPRYWGLSPNDPTTWNNFLGDLQSGYNINAATFDPATALVFWLGGLPEQPGDPTPAGFHADPARPFRWELNAPRTQRFFDFNPDRLFMQDDRPDPKIIRLMRYYPPYVEAPYVYFRARKEQYSPPNLFGTGRYEYGIANSAVPAVFIPSAYYHSANHVCVPYLDRLPDPVPSPIADPNVPGLDSTGRPRRVWRNAEKFQIITAGLDSLFDSPVTNLPFRYSRWALDYDSASSQLVPWSLGDMDNQTNFAQGTLEDELQ